MSIFCPNFNDFLNNSIISRVWVWPFLTSSDTEEFFLLFQFGYFSGKLGKGLNREHRHGMPLWKGKLLKPWVPTLSHLLEKSLSGSGWQGAGRDKPGARVSCDGANIGQQRRWLHGCDDVIAFPRQIVYKLTSDRAPALVMRTFQDALVFNPLLARALLRSSCSLLLTTVLLIYHINS